jgi:hypothetical protein
LNIELKEKVKGKKYLHIKIIYVIVDIEQTKTQIKEESI